jgi:Ca2+-dependent lipid-binding protein
MKSVDKEYMARTAAFMNAAGASSIPFVSFIISLIVSFVTTKLIFIVCGFILIIVMVNLAYKMNFEIKI